MMGCVMMGCVLIGLGWATYGVRPQALRREHDHHGLSADGHRLVHRRGRVVDAV